METLQSEWFTNQPDIARTQIIILVTDQTDVLVTIPHVIVGNQHYLRWFRRDDHRRRNRNDRGSEHHPPGLNHTA